MTIRGVGRRLVLEALAVSGALLACKNLLEERDWNGSGIGWRGAEEGLSEAKRRGVRAVAVLHADWCGVCGTYSKRFSEPEVVAATKPLVMILLDVDREGGIPPELKTGAGYVPQTVVLTGGVIDPAFSRADPKYPHFVDPEDSEELLKLLRRAAS